MTQSTRTAVTAIMAGDPSIEPETAEAVLRLLDGKQREQARVIRTGEAAKLLGVCRKTLRDWARAGRLVPVYGANPRSRVGYTEASVRALAEGGVA